MARPNIQFKGAIEDFCRFLKDHKTDGTRGAESATYIPAKPLKHYIRNNIQRLLLAVSGPDADLSRARNIAISYPLVFAILFSIDEGDFIYDFARHEELNDQRLPFEDNKFFPTRKNFFQNFHKKQWEFCAPPLDYLFERTFCEHWILPFKREEDFVVKGNSGVVHKIKILEEYDSLSPVSETTQDTCPSLPTSRVLKLFTTPSEFENEKQAFSMLLKDGQPEHIIEYLGSYEQGPIRGIMLEYADLGSLDDYFQETPPPTSEEDIIDFFESLFQLIKGVLRIHEPEETRVG